MQTSLPLPGAVDPSPTALRNRPPSERLRALLDEHERLLGKIGRKRNDLARGLAEVRAAASAVAGRMQPLIEEGLRVDRELHALFGDLLKSRDRSKRIRDTIRRLYQELQEAGILTPRESTGAPPSGQSKVDDPRSDPDVPPAPRPGAADDRGTLRGIFRRLAEALHPDKVVDEAQKASRTEAMKDVTLAYREGDYARLLELERAWSLDGVAAVAAQGDGLERQLTTLEHKNDLLKQQLKDLAREMRDLRRSAEGRMASELKKFGVGESALAKMAAQTESEFDRIREARDFVVSYRDGKISFEQFLAGPPGGNDDDPDDLQDIEGAFEEFAQILESVLRDDGGGRRGGVRGRTGARSSGKRRAR